MAGSRGDRQAREGPRAFSAGNDLAIRAAQRAGQNDVSAATSVVPFAGITRDFDAGKVIVAAINGYCLAGGLELALACDLRVAGTDAAFGFSEVTRGLAPGAGGTQRLPRIIGIGPAVEMITTGATLTRRGRLAADLSRSCRLRTS